METFEDLLEEYQALATDLALSYKNFQSIRELGAEENRLIEMRQSLEVKEIYMKSLLDRINRVCVDARCSTSKLSG